MRTRSWLTALAVVVATAIPAHAHVGSANTYLEGNAGPYRLFVTIKSPQVIPGVADIEVRSETPDVSRIETTITTLTGAGANFAPTPDVAHRSARDPQFFTSSLWLMQSGAMRVKVIAHGSKGSAEMSIPIASYARTVLGMSRALGALLFVLMIVLAVGIVAIVAAAARESRLEAGVAPSDAQRRSGRIAGAITAAVVLLAIFGGRGWWSAEARTYGANVDYFKPPKLSIGLAGGDMHIHLPPLTRPINEWTGNVTVNQLVLDHGHLMHLFLIRTPAMDQVFHLHPEPVPGSDMVKGTRDFVQRIPAGASGSYRVFADVVDATGLPWTLVGSIDLGKSQNAAAVLTGDDAGASVPAISHGSYESRTFMLPQGGRVVWDADPDALRAGVALMLRFRVEDADGKPVTDLQPYMGMAAHAAVVRSDFSVFAHLHPGGSVPMGSLELIASRAGGDPMASMPGMVMGDEPIAPEISIPYGFPQPGTYRIFIQFKRAGRIETAVFDTEVR